MIYDVIRNFFGQMNFALVSTTSANLTVVTNKVGDAPIFCVIVDNTASAPIQPNNVLSVQSQIIGLGAQAQDILYIVVTEDTARDRMLTQLSGVNVWLVDARTGRLMVFDRQPDDFYGLRRGLEASINSTRTARINRARNASNWPWVTIAIIAVNVIVFFITAFGGDVMSGSYMVSVGADFSPYVILEGQWWRLITCMFLHFGFRHLAGNMVSLALYGISLERAVGKWKFLAIYMLSGLFSSLASCLFHYFTHDYVVSAGASGAIYGLIGLMIVATIKSRGRIGSSGMIYRLGIVALFIFYSNFISSGVDVAAHIGGLVFGITFGFIFTGGKKNAIS